LFPLVRVRPPPPLNPSPLTSHLSPLTSHPSRNQDIWLTQELFGANVLRVPDVLIREVVRGAPPLAGGARSASRGRRSGRSIRSVGRMTDTVYKPGDEVLTTIGRGTVIDVRATPSGKWVFGVEDAEGAVGYFTNEGLGPAEG